MEQRSYLLFVFRVLVSTVPSANLFDHKEERCTADVLTLEMTLPFDHLLDFLTVPVIGLSPILLVYRK
jgi:hypothetical protein